MVKNLPANAVDMGSIPGSGRSPGEGNGNHSSILAREIPWKEETGRLLSMGHKRVRHDLVITQQTTIFLALSLLPSSHQGSHYSTKLMSQTHPTVTMS